MTLHRLSGADLGGFAALRAAVHCYGALCDQVLPARATVGDPRQLEQIAQPDIFAFELNLDGFHVSSDEIVPMMEIDSSLPAPKREAGTRSGGKTVSPDIRADLQ